MATKNNPGSFDCYTHDAVNLTGWGVLGLLVLGGALR